MNETTTIPKPPRSTANPSPMRAAASVRRTTSIDVEWVDGPQSDRRFHCRARDYRTISGDRAGRELATARMEATIAFDKTIKAIEADPAPANLQRLVGEKGGSHLRMVMSEVLPDLIASGNPLYLLLDDISGVSLISAWAWSQWDPEWSASMRQNMPPEQLEKFMDRAGVCWGLQLGNSGMQQFEGGPHKDVGTADGGELRNPSDPAGWHEFPAIEGVSMRRARRIDVRRDPASGVIEIDAAFQDSAPRPGGGRSALHEYRIAATADPTTFELLTLVPEARVLPFHECPGAVANALGMIGVPLPEIRAAVLAQLRGPRGCTHLNDALRALAEVPHLVEQLED
ncbi:MAG: DUF2889 domain-containing protein [Novosphingobium sp.]|nr:DUF2889 domain-containing protein [Novosphingobium sp.]